MRDQTSMFTVGTESTLLITASLMCFSREITQRVLQLNCVFSEKSKCLHIIAMPQRNLGKLCLLAFISFRCPCAMSVELIKHNMWLLKRGFKINFKKYNSVQKIQWHFFYYYFKRLLDHISQVQNTTLCQDTSKREFKYQIWKDRANPRTWQQIGPMAVTHLSERLKQTQGEGDGFFPLPTVSGADAGERFWTSREVKYDCTCVGM